MNHRRSKDYSECTCDAFHSLRHSSRTVLPDSEKSAIDIKKKFAPLICAIVESNSRTFWSRKTNFRSRYARRLFLFIKTPFVNASAIFTSVCSAMLQFALRRFANLFTSELFFSSSQMTFFKRTFIHGGFESLLLLRSFVVALYSMRVAISIARKVEHIVIPIFELWRIYMATKVIS